MRKAAILTFIMLSSLAFSAAFAAAEKAVAREPVLGEPFGFSHKDKRVSPPAAAFDGSTVYVVWAGEDGGIYLKTLGADGKAEGRKIKVNNASSKAASAHNPPSIALGNDGEVFIAWTAEPKKKSGDVQFAADIRLSRSVNGGKTFSPPVRINDNAGVSSRGFESVAAAGDGTVIVAWLDGRFKKPGRSAVFAAISGDGGATFSPNVLIEEDVCPCCKTASAAAAGKRAAVSWRKVFPDGSRDMAVSTYSDGSFSPSIRVSADSWKIAGCPHRGPSMAFGPEGVLYYAWYTEGTDDVPSAYFASLGPGAEGFSEKEPLPYGTRVFPDRASIGASASLVYAAWEEKTPVVGRVMTATYAPGAGFSKPVIVSSGARQSSNPAVIVSPDGKTAIVWSYDEMTAKRVIVRTIK